MTGESSAKQHRPLVRVVMIGIIIVFYVTVALYSQKRQFDPDEFMHLHSAWSVHKGLIPYRDYFDHYTPLFRLVFAPLFRFFKVETDIGDAIRFLFFARGLEWLISGGVLLSTFWLGKLWRGVDAGLLAVFFLMTTDAYWNLALEIRPDPLSTAFGLLSLIAVLRAVQGSNEDSIRRRRLVWSGLFLALGFLTIQKSVFEFPGIALGMCWYIWKSSRHGTRVSRIVDVAFQFLGFCIPLLATGFFFYLQHGLPQFIRYNFLFYLGGLRDSYFPSLIQFLYSNPFLVLFGAGGLMFSCAAILRKALPVRGDFIVAPAALSFIVGLFLIPTPYYQYYILFLPLVAVLAASFLLESADRLLELRERWTAAQWIGLAALGSAAVLACLMWTGFQVGTPHSLILVIGFWFSAFLGCLVLLYNRAPALATVFFVVVTSAAPSVRLLHAFSAPGVNPEFDEIRYILENTSPTETVMDGYRGSGIFRPHAYFYWFMPFNDRIRIPEDERQQLLTDLHSGSIAPSVILFDINLRNLTPGVTQFLENNYEPSGTGVVWKRKATVSNASN